LDTDDAVRMLGYCTPPARHRRYPTYRHNVVDVT